MSTFVKLLLMMGLMAAFQLGCGDDDDDDTPRDSESGEPDGGSSDEDGTESEEDTGTGEPEFIPPECADCLKAEEDGTIADNTYGIVGAWFTYGDATPSDPDATPGNSTVEGAVSAYGGYCASGVAGQVLEIDGSLAWSTYWGAGIGFNLCQLTPGEDGTVYTIEECADNGGTDLTGILGFELILSGNLGTDGNQFRVTFAEKGRGEATYIPGDQAVVGDSIKYYFEDAVITYDSAFPNDNHPEIDVGNVQALQFQVSTSQNYDIDYDFCVENILPLYE